MSNKVKVKLNKTNVRKVLQSQMMMDATKQVAIDHYGEIDSSFVGFDRVQVVVKKEGENND